MYKLIFTLLVIVAATFAADSITGKKFVHKNVDFSGDKYGADVCEMKARCKKKELLVKPAPIPHNCQALCRKEYKTTCVAAYYDFSDRKCHLLSERCLDIELEDRDGQYIYFHRLQSSETIDTCESISYKPYVKPEKVFSDTYCLMKKKRCPGPEMYLDKPWKNQKRQFCLDKCSKILTCAMVDWVPNEGQSADDQNAIGTCYHKVNKCTDAQLDVQEDSFNYLRLLKTDNNECPESRKESAVIEWCRKKTFLCSYKSNSYYLGHVKTNPTIQTCKDHCLKVLGNSQCGLIFYNTGSTQCSYRKKNPCKTSFYDAAWDAYYLKENGSCSEDLLYNAPHPKTK